MLRCSIVLSGALALGTMAGAAPREGSVPTVDSAGVAARRVALDTLEVVFALKTESNSFGAAKQAADAVFSAALANAKNLRLPGLREHYEFAALDQDFLSIGRRGSEVQHRLRLTAPGIATERIHETAIALVDAVLAADPQLWVAEMSATLSEEADAKLRADLVAAAALDAAAQARPLAEAAGLKLGPARSLRARCAASGQPDPELGGAEEIIVTAYRRHGASISTRKAFELSRPFESEVERSCGVTARFELVAP
jgi:hypothetical protein